MQITENTFTDIEENQDRFVQVFKEFAETAMWGARLLPKLSKPRLIESHGAWRNDLSRVGNHEPHLVEGLDHFKRAGHLAFWLRRFAPVVEAIDPLDSPQDTHAPLTATEVEFRKLLLAYCNEYLAFDFAFQFVKYYESAHGNDLILPPDYYFTMCHFLKYKNVSPHAMHLIYKSLFIK